MGCCTIEIEFCRFCSILTLEKDITITTANIKGLLKSEHVNFIIHCHQAFTFADIKDSYLTTSRKISSLKRVDSFQFQSFLNRLDSTDNHTIIHRINHIYFIGSKKFLYQEIMA